MRDRAEFFGEKKKNFKAASSSKLKKNTADINKLKRRRQRDELEYEDNE